MDYNKIYEKLVSEAKNRIIDSDSFYEKHHIIPSSLGGSNDDSNLVFLTTREHFFAHLLLYKIQLEDEQRIKMWYAVNRMINSRSEIKTSRKYEIFRNNFYKNHPSKIDKEAFANAIRKGMIVKNFASGKKQWECKVCGKLSFAQNKKSNTCKKCFIKLNADIKLTFDKCLCGCGLTVKNKSDKWIAGHLTKCGCGCEKDVKISKFDLKTEIRYKVGHSLEARIKVSKAIKKNISQMSKDDLLQRMKKSFGSNEDIRAANIRKAKSSILVLDDGTPEFSSLDAEKITGIPYSTIKYRIKYHNGYLPNGKTIKYVKKYTPPR